jgi:hypothetical protein
MRFGLNWLRLCRMTGGVEPAGYAATVNQQFSVRA